MTASAKIRRIDVSDEKQANPVPVTVYISVHSDAGDVVTQTGSDEIKRCEARLTCTRAQAAAFLSGMHLVNASDLPPQAVAALVALGVLNP